MDPFWHQNRAKIAPRRVLRPYFFKSVDFHETSAGVVFGAFLCPQGGAQIDPRSPQDGLKTDQNTYRFLSRFCHRFLVVLGSVLATSWGVLGSQGVVLGSFGRPLGHPGRAQDRFSAGRDLGACWLGPINRPKTAQERSKTTPRAQNDPQDDQK